MREFRQHAADIIRRVRQGERVILTYRGAPVARLVRSDDQQPDAGDPFYRLHALADAAGQSLTNRQMDSCIYGQ